MSSKLLPVYQNALELANHYAIEHNTGASPKLHIAKSWTQFFGAISQGKKKHDLRINDRNFRVGDILVLREYDFADGRYTGRECMTLITFITSRDQPCAFSSAVLDREYVILSLEVMK